MSGLWNEAELKRPPLITVNVADADFVEPLHHIIALCIKSKREEDAEFARTAALLSRLIARRKNSFRRMIGYRNLLKLNAMNCRLLKADLPRDIELFCGALPDMVCGINSIATIPTKDCLDYVLVRLLSVHHIQQCIHDCSVTSASYFVDLLRVNNFFDINTLLIAVIAKLRSLNALIGNRYIDLYQNLLKYRDRFPMKKRKGLIPNSMSLPVSLDYFEKSISEDNIQIAESINSERSNSFGIAAVTIGNPKKMKRIDIGTELERRETKPAKIQRKFHIDQLKTVEDVKRFIEAENQDRKKEFKACVTNQIPNHLWSGAQKIFQRKLEAGATKKSMNVFLKFLSTNL